MAPYLVFLIGAFVGGLIVWVYYRFIHRTKTVGRIHFVDSEPGGDPVMAAVLYESIQDIHSRKRVEFDVSHK